MRFDVPGPAFPQKIEPNLRNVLFGLWRNFYRSVNQLPAFTDYAMKAGLTGTSKATRCIRSALY
jgi:hypothetical protein